MDKSIYLTGYARKRMLERDVTFHEVEETLARPEIVEPDKDGRRKFKRGELCIVVADERDRLTVITVLWRRQHQWSSDEMRRDRRR